MQKDTPVMSDIVVKTHRLNSAIQQLSLAEIRIMQLAIVDARETNKGIDTVTPLSIHASRYAEMFGVTRQTAYKVLQEAEKSLFRRYFTFIDERDGLPVKSHWISQAKYLEDEATIQVMLTPAVVNEIIRIDAIEAKTLFTYYALEQIAPMTSPYSVRLFELLNQWRTAKKTPVFDLEIFRGQLGVPDDLYNRMSDFKRRVLEVAIKEVNAHTDLKVSYQNIKSGRKITGFKFSVLPKIKNKPKPQLDKDNKSNPSTDKKLVPMTQNQANTFGGKLANDSTFNSSIYPAKVGESQQDYEFRVKQQISKYDNQVLWLDRLIQLGYVPKYK